jgi:putative SOS response-associated peptidase YedK
MCGHIAGDRDPEETGRHYRARLDDLGKLALAGQPRCTIAPRSYILTVLRRDGDRVLTATRWVLVPHGAKERLLGDRIITVRAETVAKLPPFHDAFKRPHCVMPAKFFYDFYEWKREDGRKTPHAIRRVDGGPMSFAALTSRWTDKASSEVVDTCTIVTTAANDFMRPVHNRMPVILDDRAIGAWLESDQDTALLQSLLVPCPDDVLTAYALSPAATNPRNQGTELIAPV